MPRTGELTYYHQIGEAGRQHALAKPFSDEDCGMYLMRVGALFSLLPPPPARILECGCGTGWLTHFLAQRGYEVVGTDVAPEAIRLAQNNSMFRRAAAPQFFVLDSEALTFDDEFDAVIFFDSLHHSVNEQAALRCAYQALRPGGTCIALEPGRGHHRHSQQVEEEYDVTEKDMHPSYVWRLGRRAGFNSCLILPAPQQLATVLYANQRLSRLRRLMGSASFRLLAMLGIMVLQRWNGIIVLKKDGRSSERRSNVSAEPKLARAG